MKKNAPTAWTVFHVSSTFFLAAALCTCGGERAPTPPSDEDEPTRTGERPPPRDAGRGATDGPTVVSLPPDAASPSIVDAAADPSPTGVSAAPPLEVLALPGRNRALISWSATGGATSFDVERQTGCAGAWTRVAAGLQTLMHVDDVTGMSGPVCYRVRSLISGRAGVSDAARLTPVSADGRPAVMAIAARPNPFKGRAYAPRPLPTLDLGKLPRPIVEDRPELVKLYEAAWRFAYKHVRVPARTTGFIATYVDPVFNDHLFQWDTIFILEHWRYAAAHFPAIESLNNFYAKQHDDGFICREFDLSGKEVHFLSLMDAVNPPLYAWSEWESYRATGDKSRFREVLIPITKHYLWLQANRARPDGFYWNTTLGAGQDDLMRGPVHAWVDMTAQQAQNALYLAAIANESGEAEAASWFVEQHLALTDAIRTKMWSAQDRLFFDLTREAKPTGIKTSLAFWPLMARAATLPQVQGLVGHLFDPNVFWRPNVVPVLARGEKGYTPLGRYWNGSVWAPTNHVVVKGLDEYGQEASAARVAERYLGVLAKVFAETGTIWEYYAGESATGQGKKEYGWSNVGPIAFLIEDLLGVRLNAPAGLVVWRPWLPGRNGVENLMVGEAKVNLVAAPVSGGKRKLTMSADRVVRVYVNSGGATQLFMLGGAPVEATVDATDSGS